PAAEAEGLTYGDEPGFCYSATLAEIKDADYALTPGRYVGAPPEEDDGEPIEEKIERLTGELFGQFEESARLEAVVREQLGRVRRESGASTCSVISSPMRSVVAGERKRQRLASAQYR